MNEQHHRDEAADARPAAASPSGHPVGSFWSGRFSSVFSRPLSRRGVGLVLIAAMAVMAVFFVQHAWTSSIKLDGTRVFWLDDDQMISMRYARNLARGDGPVWNPGERVEGYTNFGWMLIMAGVHAAGVSDAKASLVVEAICYLLCCGVIILLYRLLRLMGGTTLLPLAAAVAVLVTCRDFMFWATCGFEVPLLTLLHLVVLVAAVRRTRPRTIDLIALACIPLVRADGLHLWAADALLLLALSRERKRLIPLLALTLLPAMAHLAFRRWYYGDWVPNTFHLKVGGLANRVTMGVQYVDGFLQRHWLPLLLCGAVAWRLRHERRSVSVLVLTAFLAPAVYSLVIGGDNFWPFRFMAPFVPVMIAVAALASTYLSTIPVGQLALVAVLIMFCVPARALFEHVAPMSGNGDPPIQIVVAAKLKKNASSSASVAVIPGGYVPYFSGLKAVDLLGKSDRHVALRPPHPRGLLGHGKIDPDHSFSVLRPDYFVSCRSRALGVNPFNALAENSRTFFDYVLELLASPAFRRDYEPYPVLDGDLNTASAVYVRRDSPEQERRASWRPVQVERR